LRLQVHSLARRACIERKLGNTGIDVSVLSFGASSLGAEFRKIDLNEAIKSVHVALEHGMNLIDTSPYYGRGLSESALRSMGFLATVITYAASLDATRRPISTTRPNVFVKASTSVWSE